MEGPDKGWSWVVAFACCFASLVLAGIFRTSGVLFVAFISTYGVTREAASWPMVVCITVLNLTGPVSGMLGKMCGARVIIITGALIASVGLSACYFTTSLTIITILFGGVFGVGYGFMNTLMPVILNAHFLNLRATANGIANAGSCVGSLILPVVFEYLISAYELSGCFLLTGGIVLHLVIAGSLMRSPSWRLKTNENATFRKCIVSTSSVPHQDSFSNAPSLENPATSASFQEKPVESKNPSPLKPNNSAELCEKTYSNDDICEKTSSNGDICECHQRAELSSSAKFEAPSKHMNSLEVTEYLAPEKLLNSSDNGILRVAQTQAKSSCCSFGAIFNSQCQIPQLDIVQSFRTVLTCPMFYVTAITNVCFYFLYHMYVVIILDYALDRGVPAADTKYILIAFSVLDLFGRLCLGWITDRKFVTRSRFVMGCMMLIGVVFFMFPLATEYRTLIAVSCSYGLLLGCTMVVFPILLVDFCGPELHAVAYGCMCFMNGFASLGRPFLIGHFRDSVGSYSSMFFLLGIIALIASSLWALENFFSKKREPQLQELVID